MLLNFCNPCLTPEVNCSTVSTEGYEVTNLVTKSTKGFLAYACIKPPIHIDLTFICNIEISHILLWPSVGAQKSTGFQLSTKPANYNPHFIPHKVLSTGYLCKNDSGVLFYRRDVDQSNIFTPPNFLRRYICVSDRHLVDRTDNLRISIVKAENSVPALERVEVWGKVARCCGRDVAAGIHALWMQEHILLLSSNCTKLESPALSSEESKEEKLTRTVLEVPDDFLDPITCEIMIQPIILPSGKIIDQNTLKKHQENEALWGRTPSDLFTGMPLSKDRRPVAALALKARIDKYLLENSNNTEIKKMPRTLGVSTSSEFLRPRQLGISVEMLEDNAKKNTNTTTKVKSCHTIRRNIREKYKCHQLPIVAVYSKRNALNIVRPNIKDTASFTARESGTDGAEGSNEQTTTSEIDSNLRQSVQQVLTGLKRFSEPERDQLSGIQNRCSCCVSSIFYKLPCEHVVCRKVLISHKTLQCNVCSVPYKRSDPKRIY